MAWDKDIIFDITREIEFSKYSSYLREKIPHAYAIGES